MHQDGKNLKQIHRLIMKKLQVMGIKLQLQC